MELLNLFFMIIIDFVEMIVVISQIFMLFVRDPESPLLSILLVLLVLLLAIRFTKNDSYMLEDIYVKKQTKQATENQSESRH